MDRRKIPGGFSCVHYGFTPAASRSPPRYPRVVDESPPPRGTLERWPLPALFVHVVDHRLSGSLALQAASGDLDVVVFADGAPIRARTAKMVAPLGEMLVRYGVIADVDLASALARASTAKAKLGQQLIAEKVI